MCLVKLRDFYHFITDETGALQRQLFDANVRDYQGSTQVNGEIQAALKEHPDAFGSTYEREIAYSMEFVAERLRLTAESLNNVTLGAYRQEELIGVVTFRRIDGEREQHRGNILGMYVRSEEQGKGIGRALLSKAIDLAKSLPGLQQIELAVVTRNKQARNLYASLGFASYGIDPRALLVDGEYLDEERMVLFLSGR